MSSVPLLGGGQGPFTKVRSHAPTGPRPAARRGARRHCRSRCRRGGPCRRRRQHRPGARERTPWPGQGHHRGGRHVRDLLGSRRSDRHRLDERRHVRLELRRARLAARPRRRQPHRAGLRGDGRDAALHGAVGQRDLQRLPRRAGHGDGPGQGGGCRDRAREPHPERRPHHLVRTGRYDTGVGVPAGCQTVPLRRPRRHESLTSRLQRHRQLRLPDGDDPGLDVLPRGGSAPRPSGDHQGRRASAADQQPGEHRFHPARAADEREGRREGAHARHGPAVEDHARRAAGDLHLHRGRRSATGAGPHRREVHPSGLPPTEEPGWGHHRQPGRRPGGHLPRVPAADRSRHVDVRARPDCEQRRVGSRHALPGHRPDRHHHPRHGDDGDDRAARAERAADLLGDSRPDGAPAGVRLDVCQQRAPARAARRQFLYQRRVRHGQHHGRLDLDPARRHRHLDPGRRPRRRGDGHGQPHPDPRRGRRRRGDDHARRARHGVRHHGGWHEVLHVRGDRRSTRDPERQRLELEVRDRRRGQRQRLRQHLPLPPRRELLRWADRSRAGQGVRRAELPRRQRHVDDHRRPELRQHRHPDDDPGPGDGPVVDDHAWYGDDDDGVGTRSERVVVVYRDRRAAPDPPGHGSVVDLGHLSRLGQRDGLPVPA